MNKIERPESISLKKDLTDSEYKDFQDIHDTRNHNRKFPDRVTALAWIEAAVRQPGTEIRTIQYVALAAGDVSIVTVARNELKRLNAEQCCYGLGSGYLSMNAKATGKADPYRFAALRAYFAGEEISPK